MTPFEEAVKQMRAAQKSYFQTRGMDALRESKALEKRVDAMLDDLQARQLTLGFEGEVTK